MEKFILSRERKSAGLKPTFVTTQAHENLKELSAKTNIPMTQILDRMIDFCLERLEIEPEANSED